MNEIIQVNLIFIIAGMFLLIVLLFIFNTFLFFKYKKIRELASDFFAGKKGKDLEGVINDQNLQIEKAEKDIKDLFDGYEKIYKMAFKGIHKVGVVRYNPFNDIGGNQSFAVAFLDGDNSGIIITSLHTRESTRIFSKSILRGISPGNTLTEEEKKAIKTAKVSKKSATV